MPQNSVSPREVGPKSLRWKLILGFAATIGLTICVGMIAVSSQIHAKNIVGALLNKDVLIADLSLESKADMLNAWRYERELLVLNKSLGFDEAKGRYLTLVRYLGVNIHNNLAEIPKLTGSPNIIQESKAIDQAMIQSETTFLGIANLLEQRLRSNTGLVPRLRRKGAEMESTLSADNSDLLKLDKLTIDLRERDYLLRGIDTEANDLRKAVATFKADVMLASLDSSEKEKLQAEADDYLAVFDQLVRIDSQAALDLESYLTLRHQVESLLEKLHDEAVQGENAARANVEQSTGIILATVLGAVATATCLGLIVAVLISSRIAGGVKESMEFVKRVADGELGSRLKVSKQDEFGALATGLNRMMERLEKTNAERLKEVAEREQAQVALSRANEDLELRVQNRTRDLSVQNEQLELETAKSKRISEELDRIFNLAEDMIATTGFDGYCKRINPAFERLLNYTPQELMAEPFINFVHPEDRATTDAAIGRTLSGDNILGSEERVRCKDGTYKWIQWNVISVPSEQLMYSTGRDITQIKRAEAQLEETNKQLMETSRRAGMAEVATTVLHNVGNVLNSVNVSCSLLAAMVRKSRVGNVMKTADLLREHTGDLAAFFTTDPKGRQLPDYLGKLAELLVEEQSAFLSELQLLDQNINHIKVIVAVQQDYGKNTDSIRETLPIENLIEDALRMSSGSFTRHHIEIIREYETIPPISLEKHKVLQILVNLVHNAKHALTSCARDDKRLTIRMTSDDRYVRVSLSDNGIGITPENLTRIFAHGFSTKKEGHGFGLHGAALAAKQMGGQLTVQSDGPDQGATFTLELPLKPSEPPTSEEANEQMTLT